MYLRFGWIVGNVGLGVTILIVVLSSSITFITALSASAVATNMRVGVGGEYFMISRSLGIELGGAIGIPLFLCRTLSITFYSFGLAESIVSLLPQLAGSVPAFSTSMLTVIIIILITAVSGRSAALALKIQIPIMIAVGLSIIALIAGMLTGGFRQPEWTATYRTAPEGFWYVFAIFFPAVTGFTAGMGMSGDLKDPRHSIPRGTLLAVVTGTLVYLIIPFLLAFSGRVTPDDLARPGVVIWSSIAIFGVWLIYPGLWGAILSSAFGSALGGPRVLQALASDGLAPKFLSRLSKNGQPTIATWISGCIALAAVALGGLNAVAQFVTILFLTLYITINLSAAIEKWAGDPSYRPTINVPWYVSMLGSLGALAVMFLINPYACILAALFETTLFWFLRQRSLRKQWGDVRAGFWVALARFALIRLNQHRSDPRNWRPLILLFVGEPAKRIGLVRLACWFNQDRGIVTACQILVGDLEKKDIDLKQYQREMERSVEEEGLVAFCQVNVVRDFESGIIDIIQSSGVGSLRSNTLIFGYSDKPDRLESMLRTMRASSNAGKSTIIAKLKWAHEPGQRKRIDIWWRGKQRNGDLMLLLAYLLKLNEEWHDAGILVRSIVNNETEKENMDKSLSTLIPETRIQAEAQIILKEPDKSVEEVIHSNSKDADLVMLGLMDPEPGQEANYAQTIMTIASGLNTTIFVRNAGEFAGRLI